jgi:hypothetical protein
MAQVEGVQLRLVIVPPGDQGVEVGRAVNAQHRRDRAQDPHFVIDGEAVIHRKRSGPVVAVAGDQAHAVAVALMADAKAVVLRATSRGRPGRVGIQNSNERI